MSQTTPEIEEMQATLEQGRAAFRDGKTLFGCPHRGYLRGYWLLGYRQERDNESKVTVG